jgi:hypothetical protein
MKHAGPATLLLLEALLEKLRLITGLVEKKPGIFYCKSKAYLHFHEDVASIFADVRLAGEHFERFEVNTRREQEALLERIQRSCPSSL